MCFCISLYLSKSCIFFTLRSQHPPPPPPHTHTPYLSFSPLSLSVSLPLPSFHLSFSLVHSPPTLLLHFQTFSPKTTIRAHFLLSLSLVFFFQPETLVFLRKCFYNFRNTGVSTKVFLQFQKHWCFYEMVLQFQKHWYFYESVSTISETLVFLRKCFCNFRLSAQRRPIDHIFSSLSLVICFSNQKQWCLYEKQSPRNEHRINVLIRNSCGAFFCV